MELYRIIIYCEYKLLLVLQNISEEQNLNSEILLRSIITCVNDEEELMRNIKKISEVNIPKEVYVKIIINLIKNIIMTLNQI